MTDGMNSTFHEVISKMKETIPSTIKNKAKKILI